jgi:hypothetical protein
MSVAKAYRKSPKSSVLKDSTGNEESTLKNTRSSSPSHTKLPSRTLSGSPSSSEGDNLPDFSLHPKVSKLSPKLSPNDFPLLSNFSSKNHNDNSHKLNVNPLNSNASLDLHYATLSLNILSKLFTKTCGCKNPNLLFFKVKNRPTVARCSKCHRQVSITSKTPLENFKLPISYFSYVVHDSLLQYPKSITSTEISRKLEIPYKTAYYLKRRIQIFFSLLNEKLQEQMYRELSDYNERNPIKLPQNGDLRDIIKDEPVAVADSVVLYSSSLRANKHRSRRFKTGTSSIYLSNSLGGEQKGVLVHTVGINHGMTFYKSIPLNNQNYLGRDLESKIPKNTILFTDEGYSFIWDRMNHRMVNHSKRSGDARYNLSRERWITKEGVSSNGAEARNNLLKQSFRSYNYISPKWSQLYLDELSFLGNVRYSEPLRRILLGDGVDVSFVSISYKN